MCIAVCWLNQRPRSAKTLSFSHLVDIAPSRYFVYCANISSNLSPIFLYKNLQIPLKIHFSLSQSRFHLHYLARLVVKWLLSPFHVRRFRRRWLLHPSRSRNLRVLLRFHDPNVVWFRRPFSLNSRFSSIHFGF